MKTKKSATTVAQRLTRLCANVLLYFAGFVLACVLIATLTVSNANAMSNTSRQAVAWRLFQQKYPCPSTHKKTGKCPGWVMQYKRPLDKGGDIAPYNLRWEKTH